MSMSRKQLAVALSLSLALAGQARAESITTLFGVVPNPGLPTVLAGEGELSLGVGEFPGAVEINGVEQNVLNGLESFTSFNVQNLNDGSLLGGTPNQGQVIFLQNANFYVGGGQIFPGEPLGPNPPAALGPAPAGPIAQQAISAQGQENLANLGVVDTNLGQAGLQTFNNRVFGVFGTGRSDIVFDVDAQVTELTLQAGITVEGFNVGNNAAFGQSLPEGTALADGDGTILVYTDQGLQAAISLADVTGNFVVGDDSTDFGLINQDFTISLDGLDGDAITRISIINEGTSLTSAAFLSELTVTAAGLAVPEPTSLAMLALAAVPVMARRRR